MKNSLINQKIIDLWNTYFQDSPNVYAPLFYDDFKKRTLVFVGVNPSFSTHGFKSFLKNTEYADIDPTIFLKWSNIRSNLELIDDCIKIDSYAQKNYPIYFGRPREIAHKPGVEWQHIDIFLYRETYQKKFIEHIKDEKEFNQLAKDQIAIFEEVLIQMEPRCIVVINAFASELLREHIKDDLVWDEEKGFHWFTRAGKKVPIFFSGMLSGQRSLDRWSYERLVWHIKKAINI